MMDKEKAGVENAGLENDGQNLRGWKCRAGKWRTNFVVVKYKSNEQLTSKLLYVPMQSSSTETEQIIINLVSDKNQNCTCKQIKSTLYYTEIHTKYIIHIKIVKPK